MTNEIDRSSYRLEVAAKLDRLACDLQKANAAIIDYASSLLGGDDHAIDENAMMAIKVGGKIAGKAHLLRDIAERLETADKDEARQHDEDEFMDRILKARIGGAE